MEERRKRLTKRILTQSSETEWNFEFASELCNCETRNDAVWWQIWDADWSVDPLKKHGLQT